MHNLARHISTKVTPQSRAIPGKTQVANNAGGFVYTLDCWKRLDRFLILGSEGGTYYVGEDRLTLDNAKVVAECAAVDGERTVNTVVGISTSGRAPKNDAAILALAVLASNPNVDVRKLALKVMPQVCRTGTHLFQFIEACKELRGWGRGLRESVASWYNGRTVNGLTYQVTKYRNRAGYTHRDALRLSHPRTTEEDRNDVYRWIVNGTLPTNNGLISAFHALSELAPTDISRAINLITDNNLTLEHVPNYFLSHAEIWDALLPNLQPTAIIRNLGKMTNVGLLQPLSVATRSVYETLTDATKLIRARVHPLSVLLALDTYRSGHGFKGSLTWRPTPQLVEALEMGFYKSFDAVRPTNKRHLLAVDVSGSMGWSYLANTRLSARDASACMSLVTNRVEPQTYTVGFSHELTDLGIHAGSNLSSVIDSIKELPMKRTDCAQPMIYAKANKLEVDAFVVYTDNETWCGDIHPSQALEQYRQASGIDAKLIVVGLTATNFSIADPNDSGMLDLCGFDASCPALMADFVRG